MPAKLNIRQRIEAFWSGSAPEVIPYTIYQNEWRHTQDDPAWLSLFERGLGLTWPVLSYCKILKGAEYIEARKTVEGKLHLRQAYRTPLGEVSAEWLDEWPVKYWLMTPQDYRVMQYVIEHTQVEPYYQGYLDFEAQAPGYVIVHADVGPSPIQKIIVDYAGLEQFAYHLSDDEDAVLSLFDALHRQFRQICEVVAGGPGRYVAVPESFSAEMLSPRYFKRFLLDVYEECFPALRSAGKIVGTHFDGKTTNYKDDIRAMPVDLIESLTPPPEGDQALDEARRAWPGKLFWCNINVSCYGLPAEGLKQIVHEYVRQASPDGRCLAFEISEQYPENWKESIPVVLEALQEFHR